VLEILERVELFYNFYRVGNFGKSWCVSSADEPDIGRTMFQINKLSICQPYIKIILLLLLSLKEPYYFVGLLTTGKEIKEIKTKQEE